MDEKLAESKMPEIENTKGAGDRSKARITTQPVFVASREDVDIDSLLIQVPPDVLGLFIVNSGDLMLVEQAKRITLGRKTEDTGSSISVDLTPYGGMPLGVSRQHAAILIEQGRYTLQDLGGTNGTRLNGTRLPPGASRVLRHDDTVQLGQLRIRVIYHI